MQAVCRRAARFVLVLLLGLLLSTWGLCRAYGQEEGATQLPLPERGGAVQGEREAPQTQEQREQAEREARRAQEQHQQAEREAHQAQEAHAKAEAEARRFTSDEAAKLFQQAEQLEREGKAEAAADLKKKAEKVEADARESRERAAQKERAQKAEGGGEGQAQAVRESDLRGEIAALRQDVKRLQDQVAELTALVRKLLPQQ